ncbi:Helitron helicase [Phytophthora megakarya]|uniref:Helitron helicase n=1 Tax=Phytophthora megakarya TaxID=4795 RepID=A0A225W098_9STRA|nr:Helitron helicase [Phytophthora megakarya]
MNKRSAYPPSGVPEVGSIVDDTNETLVAGGTDSPSTEALVGEGLVAQIRELDICLLATNREQYVTRRVNLSEDHRSAELEKDRLRHINRRAQYTEEDWEAEGKRTHARRLWVRLGYGLTNSKDFNKSRVSGPDVEDDQHVLPALEQCDKCRAWQWPATSTRAIPYVLRDFYKDPQFRQMTRAYNSVFGMVSAGASDGKGHTGPVREDRFSR